MARLQAVVIMDAGPRFQSSLPIGTFRRPGPLCLLGAPVSMICVRLVLSIFIFVSFLLQSILRLSTVVLFLSSVSRFFSNYVVVGSFVAFCGLA